MAQSLLELQRGAVLRMLNLNASSGDQSWSAGQTWKVFVYDKFCQEVVAPLVKIGGLRNHGVTLHLNLNAERSPVADVPAVYFVEPTEANVAKIVEDLGRNLYESCYVNFASAVPRPLLEDLAKGALKAQAAQKVAGVFDRYVSFVSLAPNLFSLNLPAAYETLHSKEVSDSIMESYVERIVDGLLSALVTMRVLPVIRCPGGNAAEMVAQRLEERIRELLNKGGATAAELFSSAAVGGARAAAEGPAGSQRPLLCILDRDVDLVTMVNHTWTYQAMCQDVLGMRLNRLSVPVESQEQGAPPVARAYDVDESDSFWATHAGDQFPEVLNAVPKAIEEFEKKRAEMSSGGEAEDPSMALAPGLAAAINALPEMTEKKRCIDMHTNIASALVKEVTARELDRYYELEDQFASQSLSTSISNLEQILNSSQKGTAVDKLRALMVLVLTKPNLTEQQIQGLAESLENAGGDASAVRYLEDLAKFHKIKMDMPGLSTSSGPGSSSGSTSSGLSSMLGGGLGSMLATGEGLLAAGMSGIKNIVASKKELLICQIMEALMDQKQGGVTDNYLYLDPKAPRMPGQEVPRIRAPFRRAFTFVVGGGNYMELQSLQDWANASGRQVAYGATDMVSPVQFVDELSRLGAAQRQSAGGGMPDLS